jgi:hypothetical protein
MLPIEIILKTAVLIPMPSGGAAPAMPLESEAGSSISTIIQTIATMRP